MTEKKVSEIYTTLVKNENTLEIPSLKKVYYKFTNNKEQMNKDEFCILITQARLGDPKYLSDTHVEELFKEHSKNKEMAYSDFLKALDRITNIREIDRNAIYQRIFQLNNLEDDEIKEKKKSRKDLEILTSVLDAQNNNENKEENF